MSFTDKIKTHLERGRDLLLSQAETANQRISICNSCEHLSGVRNCKKCGCFVDAKVKLKNVSCPIGKW
jgi:primosomal protein N'